LAYENGLGRLDAIVHPKKNTGPAIALIIMGLASVVILAGFYFLWLASRTPALNKKQAARRIYLFDRGFVELDGRGQFTAYRWDLISGVLQLIEQNSANGVPMPVRYDYTVTRRDGQETHITKFYEDIERLGRHICDQVAQAHLPAMEAAIARGETVHFGPMSLGQQGIGIGRKLVPWTEAEGVRVSQGYVSIKRAGKWWPSRNTAASNISNLYLFLHLADRYAKGHLPVAGIPQARRTAGGHHRRADA
jgi:hypothetical protein